jgi:hypothetical protein
MSVNCDWPECRISGTPTPEFAIRYRNNVPSGHCHGKRDSRGDGWDRVAA